MSVPTRPACGLLYLSGLTLLSLNVYALELPESYNSITGQYLLCLQRDTAGRLNLSAYTLLRPFATASPMGLSWTRGGVNSVNISHVSTKGSERRGVKTGEAVDTQNCQQCQHLNG